MRVAYATGRYESQMQSDAEYLYYSAVLDQLTRPDHSKMHGTILPKTHPWWNKNYPPNGWHCRCKARAFTKEELQSRGLKPSNFTPPNIADKDWAYHVGKTDRSEEIYKEKVEALKCKSKNAKGKEVDCGFLEEVKEAFKEDVKAIAQNATLFRAVQELFVEPNKKVELCKSDVFGKEKRVLLSSDTVDLHKDKHPEITAFEYALIPSMLEGEKKVFIQDDTRYIILKKLGKFYRLTLKDIQGSDEIFAVSLFHAGSDEEKAIKRIIDGIKNKK